MHDFGELLKHLCKERDYTQAQLAEKLGKSKSAICRYENNQKLPSLETLIDISNLFNTSLDYLVGIEKKESISTNDLSARQFDIIKTLLTEFHDKKKYRRNGLTKCQLEIMNEIIIEFMN